MRCLYCGEPLSLLRKLTGKAEFCSEAHREAYQDEFNSLALQRLASQPKQSARREPVRPSEPPRVPDPQTPPPAAVAEAPPPFDDFDCEPTFDSPIFTGQPEVSIPVEQPPPPMWGRLPETELAWANDPPLEYGFPLVLADFPRACRMSAAWAATIAEPAAAMAGYVDLPEYQDDDTDWLVVEGPLPSESSAPAEGHWPGCRVDYPLAEPTLAAVEHCLALLEDEGPLSSDAVPDLLELSSPSHYCFSSLLPTSPKLEVIFHRVPLVSPARWDAIDGAYYADDEALACEPVHLPLALPPLVRQTLSLPVAATAPLAEPALAGPIEAAFAPCVVEAEGAPADIACVVEPFADSPVIAPTWASELEAHVGWSGLLPLEVGLDDVEDRHADSAPLAFATSPLCTPSTADGSVRHVLPAGPIEATFAVAELTAAGPAAEPLPWAVASPKPLAHEAELAAVTLPEAAASAFVAEGLEAGTLTIPATWQDVAVANELPHRAVTLDPAPPSSDDSYDFDLAALALVHEDLPVPAEEAVTVEAPAEPATWLPFGSSRKLLGRSPRLTSLPMLARVRVKDFAWPDFAAGCDSLFTPDQPFRFHEMPFPQRGLTEGAVAEVLKSDLMQSLLLPFSDDRFDSILRSPLEQDSIDLWLDESGTRSGIWPSAKSAEPAAATSAAPAVEPQLGKQSGNQPAQQTVAPTPRPKLAEPPASWQQAARAMFEGEQQVPRDPRMPPIHVPLSTPPGASTTSQPIAQPVAPPPTAMPAPAPASYAAPTAPASPNSTPVVAEVIPPTPGHKNLPKSPAPQAPPAPAGRDEYRAVSALPVRPPEPLTGLEVTRAAQPEPPTPYVRPEPLDNTEQERAPASDQPQFEWRREQPHASTPPPSGGSNISVNTTIVVDGNADGVVVESAVRISLGGNKKKKEKIDAIERFAEGEAFDEDRVQIAPPEDLPDFVADDPELRAVVQPIASLADSIQWPKFSVTPMRRRIAFGPPPRQGFFGGNGTSAPKPAPAEAKPLPPKKSVGFLFKKLTNS